MKLNDRKWLSLKSQGYSGSLNSMEYQWLVDQTALPGLSLNDQWMHLLTSLGYTTGTLNYRQMQSWKDQGCVGDTWGELAYCFWAAGGTYGPSVRIELVAGGSCTYEPPGTTSCSAQGTYQAVTSGFTNPAGTFTYQWSIVPVTGSAGIQGSSTNPNVLIDSLVQSDNVVFELTVDVTETGSGETANRTTQFTQQHIDTNVAPFFIGPNIANTTLTIGVPINVDVSDRFTGTNLVFALEGPAIAGISIDANTGVISGTPDPGTEGIYVSRYVTATNSKGVAQSNLYTTTVQAAQVAAIVVSQVAAGSCDFTAPQTSCQATGTYTATPSGFTPDTWVWSILSGSVSIVGGQGTDTVQVASDNAIASQNFTLQCKASEGPTDALDFQQFQLTHTDLTVAPTFIGPNISAVSVTQGVAITPIDISDRFSGYIQSYSLQGTWPTGLSINSSGVISGTPTGASGDYTNLQVRATNYVGSADSNAFIVTVETAAVAPVFDPVPAQQWLNGDPVNLTLASYLTAGTLPLTWAIQSGSLPTGVTLNTGTGLISGTPTVDSTGSVTVRATNAAGFADAVVGWEVAASFGPAFLALTYDPAQITTVGSAYAMMGVVNGVGGLTTTHTATLYAPDFEGVQRAFAANEPVWSGGRVVKNELINSSDMSQSNWAAINATKTPGQPDPVGGTSAVRVTATLNDGRLESDLQPYPLPTRQTVYQSVWLKRVSGSGSARIGNGIAISRTQVTLTDSWRRYSYAALVPQTSDPYTKFSLYLDTNGDVVDVWQPQSELLNGDTDSAVGNELVLNGDFASAANWTLGTGWTISGNQLHQDGTGVFTSAAQAINLSKDIVYRIEIDVPVLTAGFLRVNFQSNNIYQNINAPGKYTYLFMGGQDTGAGLWLLSVSGLVCSINSISIYATDIKPSEYIPTLATAQQKVFANANGNTVLNNVVTEAIGAPLPELPYLQNYPAATNSILHSSDYNQTWVLQASIVADRDQVGLTGEPNTATDLYYNEEATARSIYQNITIAPTTNAITNVYWIRKETGSPDSYPAFSAPDNATIVVLDTVAGTLNAAVGGAAISEVVDAGAWWKVLLQVTGNGVATSYRGQIYPRYTDSPTGVSKPMPAGPGCVCANVEVHLNKTIAEVRGLGPIFTTTAAVSTDATIYDFDASNYGGNEVAWYSEINWPNADQGYTRTTITPQNIVFVGGDSAADSRIFGAKAFAYVAGHETTPVAQIANGTTSLVNSKWGATASVAEGKATMQTDILVGGLQVSPEVVCTAPAPALRTIFRVGTGPGPIAMGARNIQRYDITSYAAGKQIIDDLMSA